MKFIDIEARWASIAPNVLGKLSEQFESGDWIQGSKVYQFEEFLAKELRASGVKSCASGSDALWLALKLAGVSAGDEIILPPVTFAATLQAIIKVGATPIFADVNSETWTIDLESVQEVITNKTKAVIAVNLCGLPPDLIELQVLTRSRGIVLIEDSAQGFGSEIEWRPTHSFVDISCYSFFPTKNLGGIGDGGALVVRSGFIPQLVSGGASQLNSRESLDQLSNQGIDVNGQLASHGWNSRLDVVQAIALTEHLKSWRISAEKRRQLRAQFEYFFESLGDERIRFRLQRPLEGVDPNWSLMGVWTDGDRDALVSFLNDLKIPARVYYDPALHLSPFSEENLSFSIKTSLEVSEKLTRGWFFLPFHENLKDEDFHRICESILDWRDSYGSGKQET